MNPFVISLAVRLTILLLAGGLMAVAVQRSSYRGAPRRARATLACVIALPITMILVPEWRVGVLPSEALAMVPLTRPRAMTHARRRRTTVEHRDLRIRDDD